MKDIKKQLLNEFNSRVPKMSDELRNYPITTSVKKSRMPRFSFYMLGAITCLALLIALPFMFKKDSVSSSCYLFEVNPSVLVFTDDNGQVIEIKSGNEDADVVLLGLEYEKLIGKEIEEVTIVLVDNLIQLGYFDSNSTENIMKVSTIDADIDVASIISDYTSSCGYFVAVLEDSLSFETFNEIFESSVSNLNEIKDCLKSIHDLKIDNKSPDMDYQTQYKEEYYNKYLAEVIFSDLEKLDKVEDCLIELNEIYDSISEITLFKDYWIVKSFYASNPDSMDEELKVLMTRMEELLNDYFVLTESKITSGPELKVAYACVLAIPVEDIRVLAETLNSEELSNNMEALVNFIRLIDEDSASKLEEFSKVPENFDDYKTKVKDIQTSNYEAMKKNYETEYNKTKESISSEQYSELLDKLIEKYGDLKIFWENR